jgi:hypothetical protein
VRRSGRGRARLRLLVIGPVLQPNGEHPTSDPVADETRPRALRIAEFSRPDEKRPLSPSARVGNGLAEALVVEHHLAEHPTDRVVHRAALPLARWHDRGADQQDLPLSVICTTAHSHHGSSAGSWIDTQIDRQTDRYMHACLSPRSVAIAFELDRPEVTADTLAIQVWNGPADDLIDWLSRIHRWSAEQSRSYLTMLEMLDDEDSATSASPEPVAVSAGNAVRLPPHAPEQSERAAGAT